MQAAEAKQAELADKLRRAEAGGTERAESARMAALQREIGEARAAAEAAEAAAARSKGACVALETELAAQKQREQLKVILTKLQALLCSAILSSSPCKK